MSATGVARSQPSNDERQRRLRISRVDELDLLAAQAQAIGSAAQAPGGAAGP
jgi:hypothetical protein